MTITVVVPVSPIPSHPDTKILEETITSVRHHLPDAEVMVTFDGVREEQADRADDYAEHIRRALWLADHVWRPVTPVLFTGHHHQIGMMREVIDTIDTPLLLYVEQDCPLVTDEPIDWELITKFILSGESNLVRLAHEAVIPQGHLHMMHGCEGQFVRTSQWSQRPHVASVAYYRAALNYFSPNAKCFIEDKMYGVVDNAYLRDGMLGLNIHRLHVYNPGPNMKRSYTTDGRAGEPKWDEDQVW